MPDFVEVESRVGSFRLSKFRMVWLGSLLAGFVVVGGTAAARAQEVTPPASPARPPGSRIAHPSSVSREDVRQLAHAVDEHYNQLRSLQADFTEIYRGEGTEREESGTLWLKKPRKMRWEYRSPKAKLFISDGQSVWFYLPAEKQLRKTDFRKLDDVRSPIAFLLGKTKLEKELQGLSKASDQAPLSGGKHGTSGRAAGHGGSGERGAAGDYARFPDRAHRADGPGGRGDRVPLHGMEREFGID